MHTYVTVGKEYKTGMYVSALLDNMVLSMTVSQNIQHHESLALQGEISTTCT